MHFLNQRVLGFLFLFFCFTTMGQSAFPVVKDHEKKIKILLKQMSIDEKIGQTCQITLDAILKSNAKGQSIDPPLIDPDKLKSAFSDYKVGSILNVSSHTFSLEQWKIILESIKEAEKQYGLRIPVIYGIDAIHGVNYTVGGTLFPQEIGLAATWNRNLAAQFGGVTAYEARATGIPWNFSPVLDLGRQPLWSRFFETLGEDPYLASELGKQIVEGYQGKSALDAFHVAACLKHFVGYSAPFSGRDRTPAWIPEKYMQELYLPSFKASVEAGAMTLMINSGDVNGVPGHVNEHLMTDVLKKEWGFRGFTVSDWEDFIMLETVHNVGGNLEDAVVLAFNAGVDMSMVPNNPQYIEYCNAMKSAFSKNRISKKRLDDAVARILRVKMALGLFDSQNKVSYPLFGSKEHQEIAYQSALESITLLKNEASILPLTRSKKILIAGPTANNLVYINGAWTHTWQGVDTSFNTKGCLTVLEAFKKEIGAANCLYSKGADLIAINGWEESTLLDTADFLAKAEQVETIVLCLGEMPATEKPGDIRSLNLPKAQLELAQLAYRTGKPVVVVLLEGRPRIIHSIVEGASAIVQCYLPGDYGAKALVDLVFGNENFSGKLPYTYPKYDGVFEFYDHPKSVDRSGKTNQFDAFDPEWEFGYGMSYTKFDYTDVKSSKSVLQMKDSLQISVKVTNTGDRDGKEIVQLYVSDKTASMVPAGKKLKAFEKIDLKSGESKIVNFTLSKKDVAFYNSEKGWIVEPGFFEFQIGNQKVPFEIK
jgi:beta-glucosidase